MDNSKNNSRTARNQFQRRRNQPLRQECTPSGFNSSGSGDHRSKGHSPASVENRHATGSAGQSSAARAGIRSNESFNVSGKNFAGQITQLTPSEKSNENYRELSNDFRRLKIPPRAVQLPARAFDPENIHFGRIRYTQEYATDWARELTKELVLKSVSIDEWAVLYSFRDERFANTFSVNLMEVARRFGISITSKPFMVMVDDYCQGLRKLSKIQIALILFPTRENSKYTQVKSLCNELGIPSQVIDSTKLRNPRKLDRDCDLIKTLMQMNCKIGGALWGINLPHKEEGVMVCGLEWYHVSKPLNPDVSVAALVSSIDKYASRWSSHHLLLAAGEKIYSKLGELFKPCFQEWFKLNGQYPKRIIIYRSGMGDGQSMDTVQNVEVEKLKEVFTEVEADYKPALTFVVVQKPNGCSDNTSPGTVPPDHVVTERNLDFYLTSPTARQGTGAPTCYTVLENSGDLRAEVIQFITFKFTHLYYNWDAAIPVPVPCQYARKLARECGMGIPAPTVLNMKNTPYFL